MKRFICLFGVFLSIFVGINMAEAVENPTGVTFIYINGSFLFGKDTITAIFTSAHNEIGGGGFFTIGSFTDHNTAANITISCDSIAHRLDFVNIHTLSPFLIAALTFSTA